MTVAMVTSVQSTPIAAHGSPEMKFPFASAQQGRKNRLIFLPFVSFLDGFVSSPPTDTNLPLLMESIHHYAGRAEEHTR